MTFAVVAKRKTLTMACVTFSMHLFFRRSVAFPCGRLCPSPKNSRSYLRVGTFLTRTRTGNHKLIPTTHMYYGDVRTKDIFDVRARYRTLSATLKAGTSSTPRSVRDTNNDSREASLLDIRKGLSDSWNVAGLLKETARLSLRCHKKIAKASTRYAKASEIVEELSSGNPSLEELDQCPNIDAIQEELDQLRARLSDLNELEGLILKLKHSGGAKKNMVLPEDIATLAIKLDVNDSPPTRRPQGKKKRKGPAGNGPRLPYRKYYTSDKTEIRVGKQAEDNDELSTSPKHRDGSDWWMHASGCAGSHVVIRCGAETLADEVIRDAAALAARQSKCNGNVIKVSLTRCRNVTKPRGAKPGLVQLSGSVRTIVVNMKEAQTRLERLDQTVVIN